MPSKGAKELAGKLARAHETGEPRDRDIIDAAIAPLVEALGRLTNAAYTAERIAFDTYSNAQKLRWDEVEGNCKEVMQLLKSVPEARALLSHWTPNPTRENR